MTSAPSRILELIDRFRLDHDRYRRPDFNETQARRELIDPLFLALGWDIDNRHGRGEVRHEDRVVIMGKTKAPDYGFRLDGRLRYFVEAKKPSVDLDRHNDSAYQLRRYAWTAKLPLSVLTDFEEFAVYDARVRPQQGDSPRVARLRYWRYTEYEDAWDDIAAIFSREAVLGGSLDAWAADMGGKKGAATVDAEFLKEIERWRDLLARNIALRNPGIDERDLNYAVQQTIDRLLFLRIAEDRGIEPYGRLRELTKGGDVYSRLFLLYNQADARYNSGLFHFGHERGRGNPDMLTPRLNIDDKALKDIILNLYEPISPYEFSVFPADILGHVYEQFLGKVIRLTGKSARVEEKPEVRKAGGVYYTPTYIVDYIVRQTVGALLEGHAADPTGPVSRLRVLDPACGSGSFLLGAYQFLLDWHLQGYLAAPSKWSKGRNRTLHQTADEEYHLTLAERKRILLDNIYGVDIDPQAVEVTKLSLLLKVVEESPEARSDQATLLAERLLPDLGDNIKCGNSLIGPDFYDGTQAALFDMGEQMRINAFDWHAEFRDVMSSDGSRFGGFDAVIGNPPYIRIQTMKEWAPAEVEFYKQRYRAASKGNYDIYVVFVERGLQLLNPRGRLGFILPHKFFNAKYGEPIREVIAGGRHLSQVVHFADQQVFAGAMTYTCLLFLEKTARDQFFILKVNDLDEWDKGKKESGHAISTKSVSSSEWNFVVGPGADLFEKMNDMPVKLGDVAHIFVGLQTSLDGVYVLKNAGNEVEGQITLLDGNGDTWKLERELLRPFLYKNSMSSYEPLTTDHWIIFPYTIDNGKATLIPSRYMAKNYPHTWQYLQHNSSKLRGRESGKFNNQQWYAYGRTQNLTQMDEAKLIVQVVSQVGKFAYDTNGVYFTGGGNGAHYGVRLKPIGNYSMHYIQALLSSSLHNYLIRHISTPFRGGYWSFAKRFIEQLPIRTIDPANPDDKANHDRMVELVEGMLDLNKRLAAEHNPQVKTVLQRQIDATDRQIDALVYALYGLTDEEIAIVEG